MAAALIEGAADGGADVLDVGMVGTEMVYFAVGELGLDGGVMVTASHNPKEYTGMKIVRRGALPSAASPACWRCASARCGRSGARPLGVRSRRRTSGIVSSSASCRSSTSVRWGRFVSSSTRRTGWRA
jgi:hypothetical protein